MPMPQNAPGDDITAAEWNQLADQIDLASPDITGPPAASFSVSGVGFSPWVVSKWATNTTQTVDWGKPRLALAYVIGGYTPSSVSLRVNTASDATTSLNIVIYNMGANGLPSTLAASWEFTADAVGTETLTGQTEPLPASGWYWCGVHQVRLAAESQPTFDQVSAGGLVVSAVDERNLGMVSGSTYAAGADLSSEAGWVSDRFVYLPIVALGV